VALSTATGERLRATLDLPRRRPRVAVVLASGRMFGAGLPLLRACAARLADAGVLALRFEWRTFAARREPSTDGSAESEDLATAVAFARAVPGIEHVVVGGKSLGAGIAARHAVVAAPGTVAGLVLLTPSLHDEGARAALRPTAHDLPRVAVPTLVVCGDVDPICDLRVLFPLVARCARPPRVVNVPGGHGFEGTTARETARNLALAADAVVTWVGRWTSPPAAQ
jgi:predicted alpha/beta-hydrolase family hydrolase